MTLFLLSSVQATELSIIIAVLLMFAIIIYLGKGDFLIAGFNRVGNEEKKATNIKRQRTIAAGALVAASILVLALFFFNSNPAVAIVLRVIFVLVVAIGITLANSWAKKKYKE